MSEFQWLGWESPSLWPEYQDPDRVFLAYAFNLVGRNLWPDWRDSEIYDAEAVPIRRLPSANEVFVGGKPRWGIYREFAPGIRNLLRLSSEHQITASQWDAVCADNHREFDSVNFGTIRRNSVVSVLHDWAVSGSLAFHSRAKLIGGIMKPVTADAWKIDFPWVAFATLGSNSEQGPGALPTTDWLFADRANLAALGVTVDDEKAGLRTALRCASNISARRALNSVFMKPEDLPRGHPALNEHSPPLDNAKSHNVQNANAVSAATQISDPATGVKVLRTPTTDSVKAIAAQFDAEGIAIRYVTKAQINERWDPENGRAPMVKAVTFQMKGGEKGRPRGD